MYHKRECKYLPDPSLLIGGVGDGVGIGVGKGLLYPGGGVAAAFLSRSNTIFMVGLVSGSSSKQSSISNETDSGHSSGTLRIMSIGFVKASVWEVYMPQELIIYWVVHMSH